MATFVTLVNLTDEGAKNFKATPERGERFAAAARRDGVTVKEMVWTLGRYDVVMILEGPNDETVVKVLTELASLGNVKTQTMRGFSAVEMKGILAKM